MTSCLLTHIYFLNIEWTAACTLSNEHWQNTSVCSWFVPCAQKGRNLFLVMFSAGSNIIIRPQSSLRPSRCGRQRDVFLPQGSRWIRDECLVIIVSLYMLHLCTCARLRFALRLWCADFTLIFFWSEAMGTLFLFLFFQKSCQRIWKLTLISHFFVFLCIHLFWTHTFIGSCISEIHNFFFWTATQIISAIFVLLWNNGIGVEANIQAAQYKNKDTKNINRTTKVWNQKAG